MQEKVEIITNHFEHYWTKIPKNGYCDMPLIQQDNYKLVLRIILPALQRSLQTKSSFAYSFVTYRTTLPSLIS